MDISNISSTGFGGRPSGTGKPDQAGGKEDFLEKLLASMDIDLKTLLDENGQLDIKALAKALEDTNEFASSNGSTSAQYGRPDFNSQEFADKFTETFGEEAFASIQGTDGNVDPKKLGDFMREQGIEMGPPSQFAQNAMASGQSGPPQGGMNGAQLGSSTLASLLELLSLGRDSNESDSEDSSTSTATKILA